MDQNLALECIQVVENLSQKEKNTILSVLKRDDKLRIGQEQKISQLKQEINTIRKNGILRAGDDQSKMCIRCRAPLGFFFNRGDICSVCRFKVCNLCQEVMFNKSWLCKLCYKQRQLKWLTGEWAAFEQNPLRKWASGSDIHSGSLQVFSGATSIDFGEPDTSRTNNNRSSKSAHNGVLIASDHDKQRVEYPKEADQHKLSQLFGVLRSRKPEETTKELQVRRVTSRKYSETDSESSSSSDVEAPSVTESELDKTESQRNVESPKSRLEAVNEDLTESPESDRQSKLKGVHKRREVPSANIEQEFVVIDKHDAERIVRPKVAYAVDRPRPRRTELDLNDSNSHTKSKHREKRKILPDQNLAREMRIKAEESTKVSQSKSVDINLNDPSNTELSHSRKVSSHSELSSNKVGDPYVNRSRESPSKALESQYERPHIRKSQESLQTEGKLTRDAIPAIRHSAENLSPQVRTKTNQNIRRSHENLGKDREKVNVNQNIRQARSQENLPSIKNQNQDEYILKKESRDRVHDYMSQKTVQTPVIDIEVTHANISEHELEKQVSSDTGIEGDVDTPRGQRSGSPYSFSMDSLPSSNPSPTMRRSIDSSIPGSSDTDSLSKYSHHEEFSGSESQVKEGSEDDFVVEEISKVRFQRISKKAAQMSVVGKMSPKKSDTYDEVDHRDRGQRKSQSRGGSGGKENVTKSLDEIFEPKSVATVSESLNSEYDPEPEVEEQIMPVRKQDSKAAIHPMQFKNLIENMPDVYINANRNKAGLKGLALSSIQNEVRDRTRSVLSSTGSEPKSAVDLSWFDEMAPDNKQNISRQTSSSSDFKVFIEDDTPKSRLDSTDSVEGMIDEMTIPHLHVETIGRPLRLSEADSDTSFIMTPVSPLPPDTFETKAGTYTLTYMESDDNLDAASTDDNLDAGSDVEPVMGNSNGELVERRVIVGRSQKQKLKATNSLDLLIAKQGKLLETDHDVVEIDAEFNEALKIANEHDGGNQSSNIGIKDTREKETIQNVTFCKFETDFEEKTLPDVVKQTKEDAGISKNCIYDNVGSLKESNDLELQIRAIPGRTTELNKTKLAPQKSLDVLILNQGELIDPNLHSVELNSELRTALEQHFQGMQPHDLDLDDILKASEKQLHFLGMQLNVGSDASCCQSSDIEMKQTTTNGTEIVIPPNVLKQHIRLLQENESSEDSDILSVIEEEEELSEASEQTEDSKVKLLTTSVLQTAAVSKEEIESDKEPIIAKSETSIKLADRIKLMEDKVRQITEVYKSPGHEKHEGYDIKAHSKFKKLQERWNAIEKHEADLLDVEDAIAGTTNDVSNETEEISDERIDKKSSMLVYSEELPMPTSKDSLCDEEGAFKSEMFLSEVSFSTLPERKETLPKRTEGMTGSFESKKDEKARDISDDVTQIVDDDPVCHSIEGIYISRVDPFKLSISDKYGRCHSLTDLYTESELDKDEAVDEKEKEKVQDLDSPDSLARCQSSWDEIDMRCSEKSIHEIVSESHSKAENDTSSFHDSNRHISTEEKGDDQVFSDDFNIQSVRTNDDDDENITHRPLVRLPKFRQGKKVSDHSRIPNLGELDSSNNGVVLEESSSSKQYEHGKTKPVNSFVQSQNDSVFPPEPQCFKVPSLPIKIESRLSSSSVPSSPDLSLDLPFTPVDSPRSDKISRHTASPQTISEGSTSQDDSGLASGGSRGTTPEHKRTDSGYSQSSIQSASLSTVTDRSTEEEEDIERVVAKVKASGNRGNLLSVVSDSRESIASFYSDAGDFSHSNIPVTGEILFGLDYNYKTGMLEVLIKKCRDIAAVDTKRKRSDPYVKTYLLPDKTRSGKRKTKVKKHTLNPTFEEQLKYSISKSELENRTLWVTVWHNDRFGRNDFLGEVTINFDYYKFDETSRDPKWYPLQERLDSQPTSILTYKGDIVLSIKFVPADKVKSSEFKGKSPRRETTSGKGQLHVHVKEARNLTAVRSNGFSDPFCKGYLLPERHRSSKQKTAVIKKNCSPAWNHMFVFEDVSVLELQERCLELTIWDYEKLASNDFLGGVRLNLGTGLSQGRPVDWMDARGEELTMWQAMLDRPNIWIDGTLILRPNMEKRKF